tara:strand:+ start:1122 stop:1274 length:153 start_codon:yes stop_codon:yes gene_type:complete
MEHALRKGIKSLNINGLGAARRAAKWLILMGNLGVEPSEVSTKTFIHLVG